MPSSYVHLRTCMVVNMWFRFYDEALSLSAYVQRLRRKHADIPMIQVEPTPCYTTLMVFHQGIASEVELCLRQMQSNLLQLLRTNVQLTECIGITGHLRNLNIFTDLELRIQFLLARDSWLQKVCTVTACNC